MGILVYCVEANVNGEIKWVSLPKLFNAMTKMGMSCYDYYELVYVLSDTTLIVEDNTMSVMHRSMKPNRKEEEQRKIRTSTKQMNVALHLCQITRLEYAALDKQAEQEDVWKDRILVKIPKAGSIPDIDYYAFQCFMADFLNIKFWEYGLWWYSIGIATYSSSSTSWNISSRLDSCYCWATVKQIMVYSAMILYKWGVSWSRRYMRSIPANTLV